ncbi:hypothetical protein CYMTET_26790 [Cymbomonas tetramitiformis]|uniref:Uncharacterized protein n=1 Tax=Cymbomonas tetramitiformis TaxID=36881 RepID=A0AAE0FRS3_9CHLO|nr:hypothetical protein CYMTET_26790 [Cymbomonas tetramitiformis]
MRGVTPAADLVSSGQGGGQLRPYLLSPQVIAEPYSLPPKLTIVSLFSIDRWRLRGKWALGWLKSAYALAKLKRALDFDLLTFRDKEVRELYEELNKMQSGYSHNELRDMVTPPMFTQLRRLHLVLGRERFGNEILD